MLKHYRINRTPPDDANNKGDNADEEDDDKAKAKIQFEIKPLPRPQAPEHMKRQASLRHFVPRNIEQIFGSELMNFLQIKSFENLKFVNANKVQNKKLSKLQNRLVRTL